jgi:hypothetical protein
VSTAAEGPSAPAVIRITPLAILPALGVALCVTPVAFAAPYLWLIYLVPILMIVWTLRVRTVADPEGLTIRRIVGRRRVTWSEISSLRLGRPGLRDRARVSAVLTDGAELPLPAVGVRDLPQLAAASGGRLPDPAGE